MYLSQIYFRFSYEELQKSLKSHVCGKFGGIWLRDRASKILFVIRRINAAKGTIRQKFAV